jgi:hypothetical protein
MRLVISLRGMPWGVALFLGYGLLILAGIGVALPYVVAQAIDAPVTPLGLLVMGLLAYTIFTVTLALQRKAAARGLAIGLTTLTLPLIPLALLAGLPIVAIAAALLGLGLWRGLESPRTRAWLDQD